MLCLYLMILWKMGGGGEGEGGRGRAERGWKEGLDRNETENSLTRNLEKY